MTTRAVRPFRLGHPGQPGPCTSPGTTRRTSSSPPTGRACRWRREASGPSRTRMCCASRAPPTRSCSTAAIWAWVARASTPSRAFLPSRPARCRRSCCRSRQPLTLRGLKLDDSDLVLFTPSSLGASTSGAFSLYFDGSDIGLDTTGEDVDAAEIDGTPCTCPRSATSRCGAGSEAGTRTSSPAAPSSRAGTRPAAARACRSTARSWA